MRTPQMPPKRYGDEEFYHPEADDTPVHSEEEKAEVRTEQPGKTPGVYTRELESPQELDMLWSTNRTMYHKEDRSPIVFFLVGFLLGGLITGLIVFLLTKQPDIKAGDSEFVDTPVEEVKVDESALKETPKPEAGGNPLSGLFGKPKAEEKPVAETTTQPEPQKSAPAKQEPVATSNSVPLKTYTVQSGDTLGGIAYRHYGSSAPQHVEKIQRANNMKSPDSLQIGQRLVIPAQ